MRKKEKLLEHKKHYSPNDKEKLVTGIPVNEYQRIWHKDNISPDKKHLERKRLAEIKADKKRREEALKVFTWDETNMLI